jgi:ADP-ribose pyrophosphatase YjhB (NUDIX family)
LLRLWRDLPLPLALRGLVLWSVNARFLIGVVGLVWDGDGRLLMARHSYLRPPGWGLPGGWLQANETFEAGVARELAEELGFEVEVGSLVSWARQRVPPHFTLAFECRLRRGVFRPSLEILEIGYFPPEQALALLNPDLRPVVAMALARRAQAARS